MNSIKKLKLYDIDINNKEFSNATYIRNLFEKAIINQSTRIAKEKKFTNDLLKTLQFDDFFVDLHLINNKNKEIRFYCFYYLSI